MEKIDLALEPIRAFLAEVGAFLPRMILAIVILVAGWLLAKFLRFAIVRGLKAVNFNVLADRAGVDSFLRQGGIKMDTLAILGVLAYWFVILAALMVAFNSLGLTYVTDLVGRVLLFIPRVIVAVLVLAFGSYFARFVSTAVTTYLRNVGLEDAELLGRLTQYAIMVFVVLISLDQMSIGVDIIRQSFLILLSGVVLALALAFGIGGQKWAAELLERWRPKKSGGKERG
jgi:Mechanosensitive ion channel, conserved TM helix